MVGLVAVLAAAGCGGGESSSPTAPTLVGPLVNALGVCAVTASEAMLPPTFTVVTIPEGDPLHGVFNTCMKTFGISHLAAAGYPDANLVHVSTVTAEYLDNDENGIPDNPSVNMALQSNHATFIHVSAIGGYSDWGRVRDFPQVGYIQHMTLMWAPNGIEYESDKGGTWCGRICGEPGDGETLEHIPELVQKAGYATAYPSAFGMESGTLGLAMDAAIEGGWYVPEDGMNYGAAQIEYFFWGLATNLGMMGDVSPGVCADISGEWKLCTRAEFIATDTKFHAILIDPAFNLPQNSPNGSYR